MYRRDLIRLTPLSDADQSMLKRMAAAWRKLNPPPPRGDWNPSYRDLAAGARFYSPTEGFRCKYAHIRVSPRA